MDAQGSESFELIGDELRAELVHDPAPDVASRHLAAMREAARGLDEPSAVTTHESRRTTVRVTNRRRLAASVAAATFALGAGIAGALTLPGEADDTAKDAVVGVETGPQNGGSGNGSENSSHGKAVSETAKDRSLTGCEKGMAVARQASSKASEHRQGSGPPSDPCSRGNGGNDVETLSQGAGGGSGGPGGGGGGGGSDVGSGGGSGGPSGGGGGGGTGFADGGGSGGPSGGGGSGSGGPPSGIPAP